MDEWEPIPLSRLSHAGFCLRRAALLTNEQVWAESADTAKGRSEHERVHTQRIERRGDSAKLYEFPVFSKAMGVSGKCDCIEAEASAQGCMIPALDFPVRLYPVEYKHGKLRAEQEYEVQLCAQAMCLEEMLCCEVSTGALYYGETHRRTEVEFTPQLRQEVRALLEEMHALYERGRTPKVKPTKACNACSLKELCLPKLMRKRSVADYLRDHLEVTP